jgi:SAM-dependent methyltransferase
MGLLMAVCRVIQPVSPTSSFLLQYWRGGHHAKRRYEQRNSERKKDFITESNLPGNKCLQISVKDEIGKKWGPNWISVDKFDMGPLIDRHDDIHDLKFADNTFDYISCAAVLANVERPWVAIAELRRVLKIGGKIWVNAPMTFPYHEAPRDYWRASPDGLRIWMEGFEEIACGIDYYARSSLAATTYYFGRKR